MWQVAYYQRWLGNVFTGNAPMFRILLLKADEVNWFVYVCLYLQCFQRSNSNNHFNDSCDMEVSIRGL